MAAPLQHPPPSLPPRTAQPDRLRGSLPDTINYADTNRINRVQDSGPRSVYRGRGTPGTRHRGATLRQVAELAGVSTGTVSNVLNRPDAVAERTRVRVEKAIAELGFVRQAGPSREAPHWRRSGHATWVFTPAATGWYPRKSHAAHPVPMTGWPFPGVPVRGRGASDRAEACWLPVQTRLTRHGLRHGHRTLMEELGTPKVLMDERMGHEADRSVPAMPTSPTRCGPGSWRV